MKLNKNLLVSPEQSVRLSTVYTGYIILKFLKNRERMTIFDIYSLIKKQNQNFHFKNAIQSLIFLYLNGLVEFNSPYIYNLKYRNHDFN